MQTQSWRPNVGIAELGEGNLFHLGPNGLEPITMVLVEFRRGRPLDDRLMLGRKIVDICVDVLNVPGRRIFSIRFVRFISHSIIRAPDGKLWDITPKSMVSQLYPFLQHPNGNANFDELREDYGAMHVDHYLIGS
jgi:hypothetical protein